MMGEEPPGSAMLIEDSDVFNYTNGQLKFSDSVETPAAEADLASALPLFSEGDPAAQLLARRKGQIINFEIISAKPVTSGKKKYVSYAILVKRLAGDGEPGVVERRYTDFLQLYQTVRRRFPTAVAQISFPRKALLGNFSLEVIQSRSTVFQNLLAGLHASHQPELAEFLFRRELTESHTILKEARFEEAAAMLKNVYLIQEKVLEELSYDTYYTLCLLVASLNAVDDAPQAQRFAEIALHYVDRYQTSEMTLPLLTLCTRLWWCVGKDKRHLEARVAAMSSRTGKCPTTLLELVMHRECPLPLPTSP